MDDSDTLQDTDSDSIEDSMVELEEYSLATDFALPFAQEVSVLRVQDSSRLVLVAKSSDPTSDLLEDSASALSLSQ